MIVPDSKIQTYPYVISKFPKLQTTSWEKMHLTKWKEVIAFMQAFVNSTEADVVCLSINKDLNRYSKGRYNLLKLNEVTP